MAGLIGVGRNTLGQASVGFQQSAGLEANRNAAQQQLNAARAAQRSNMVATGAGLGGSVGVNNYMAAKAAAAKAGTTVPTAVAPIAVSGQPAMLAAPATEIAGAISAPASGIAGGPVALSGAGMGAPVAIEAAVPAAGELVASLGGITAPTSGIAGAAGTTAATTAGTGAASTGALAGIGAIATPLLIGAGAALLLDSMFDIF
jgi:hypothetical protein